MVENESCIPDGWVKGGVKNVYNYGPKKGSKVYSNGKTKIYISDNETIPPGFKPGFSHKGSTKGRKQIFCTKTHRKRYIKKEDQLPFGWEEGGPPRKTSPIITPYGEFSSINQCEKKTKISRYRITKFLDSENKEWRRI